MAKPRPRPRSHRAPATTVPASRGRLPAIAPLIIIVAGVAAYANALTGPLIFDDFRSIVDNATVRTMSWATLLHPKAQTPMAGRPVANLSLALNYAMSGQMVETYHLWNIAVHILAALVLFGILRQTPVWPAADDRTRDHVALFSALAWLVHPLNTDAVDYITQRTESMAGLFYLLTLYAAIRAWHDEGGRWTGMAVLSCWFGVATKELVVTAPLMVVLWDRSFACPSFTAAIRQRGRLYLGLATSWLLFAALSRDTPFFSATGFETSVTPWTYLVNQAPLIARYLRLSVWPVGLVLDYGLARPLTVADVWPSALVALFLLAFAGLALKRHATAGFWGAWFFVTLAPASSVLPIPSEVGAERRMYLPLVAVLVLLVSAWRWLVRSQPAARARMLGAAFGVVVLVGLTVGTVRRNWEYRSGLAIWETVVARYPHARAHENLAIQLRDAGRVDEAIEHLRVAAPDLPDARHVLGSALIDRGDLTEGIAELQAFVQANPRDREIVSARDELASAQRTLISGLLNEKRFSDAEVQARAFVSSRPDRSDAHNLLGVALASSGQLDAALQEFRAAVRLDPQAGEPRNNLAHALEQTQQGGR